MADAFALLCLAVLYVPGVWIYSEVSACFFCHNSHLVLAHGGMFGLPMR